MNTWVWVYIINMWCEYVGAGVNNEYMVFANLCKSCQTHIETRVCVCVYGCECVRGCISLICGVRKFV